MRINELTYGKLKTPLKVNGNLGAVNYFCIIGLSIQTRLRKGLQLIALFLNCNYIFIRHLDNIYI